ncbi:Undecaprenyl-phosphate 4-deoxy-4-formamido-L-arabinose transferase [bioreactor metagenome]|uniref:Undecaprenyl-phosphate 4-deoxy-4-formamido-L-arabinose transferase n=1 Tax=bioreactor metagenome TaxID=1076179 RepID=A0A644TQY9_9ZZZZ
MVSIIIPTYNRKEKLIRAIDSVLAQTYKDFEIIIVDDGSTDGTKDYLSKCIEKNKGIIHYFYKKNGGVSSARNFGIARSKGKYISFLDSDDYLYPTKIEKQILEIKKQNADGCYCGYDFVNNEGKYFKKSRIKFQSGDILLSYLKNETTPQTNAWIIKKTCIEDHRILFREGCSWGEDMEFFTKCLLTSKMCYVNECLFAYSVNDNGALSDYSLDKIDKDIFIWNKIWEWLDETIDNSEYKKEINKIIYNYRIPALIVYQLSKEQEKNKIKQYFKKNQEYLNKIDFSNGLRSLKLKICFFILKLCSLK